MAEQATPRSWLPDAGAGTLLQPLPSYSSSNPCDVPLAPRMEPAPQQVLWPTQVTLERRLPAVVAARPGVGLAPGPGTIVQALPAYFSMRA
jgi:hypothetical protein